MAIGFVGKGLGMIAAVVPLGVLTPAAIIGSGETSPVETYHIKTETEDTLTTESGDYLTQDRGT